MSKAQGSSPLTRGKPGVDGGVEHVGGLIPAHAGKTSSRRAIGCWSWAHPRSRGENSWESVIVSWVGGSSPLTRGKPAAAADREFEGRLIPAHAGKTSTPTSQPTTRRAHPRSRGENLRGYEPRYS